MANVTTDVRSDLYGNSKLYTQTNFNISTVFSRTGCTALPLGHNTDDRNTGFVYDLAPGSVTSGHSLWFGATRSGKLVSGIAPALLTLQSSCVVVDPKLETAWITAPRRRSLGQRVVILDPWNEINERYGKQVGETEIITRFNPLSALDPTSRDFNDDVAAIADALIIVDPHDENSHWTSSAKTLIAGLIAALVELNPGKASLRDVREMITSDDDDLMRFIVRVRETIPGSLGARKLRRFAKLADDKERRKARRETGLSIPGQPIPVSADDLADARADVTDEIGSIRSTAETQTDMFDSETLLQALETDETPFNLDELVTGKITLYIGLPPDRLTTHGRWMRLILTLALRAIARAKKQPALPVMFFVDEMGTIGPLRMIEDSYGLLAGLGVRISGYLQDLNQLKRDYPRSWETFISNSSVIGILQCGDESTAKYISEYLGTKTIEVNHGHKLSTRPLNNTPDPNKQHSAFKTVLQTTADSMGATGGVATNTRKEVWEPELEFKERRVMLPSEVRNSPKDEILIIVPGEYNMRLKRFLYYSDPVFSQWARHDPNKPKPVIVQPQAPTPAAAPAAPPRSTQEIIADKAIAAASDLGKKALGWVGEKAKEKFGGRS